MNRRKIVKSIHLFVGLAFVLPFSGCVKRMECSLKGEALGTTYSIVYVGPFDKEFHKELNELHDGFNSVLSTYDPNSLISLFNRGELTQKQILENEHTDYLRTMIEQSKVIADRTQGAFDPSAAQMFALYSEAKKNKEPIDSAAMQEALLHRGMDKVGYGAGSGPWKSDSLIQINFNAIAKGYYVDLIAELLESKKISNYLVEVGGEVRTSGTNPDGDPWRVGVNTPKLNVKTSDVFKVMEFNEGAMATSGNYQNYYVVDGKIIGHTLDPRTGQPVISDLKSASVMHSSCATADAYATACMVMGLEESKRLIQSDTTLSAFFIYEKEGKLVGEMVE